VFVVSIKHRGDDEPTAYEVFEQKEMDAKEKDYTHWKEAEEGDWALSDDGYCAKVLKRKKYPNDRGVTSCGTLSILLVSLMSRGE